MKSSEAGCDTVRLGPAGVVKLKKTIRPWSKMGPPEQEKQTQENKKPEGGTGGPGMVMSVLFCKNGL